MICQRARSIQYSSIQPTALYDRQIGSTPKGERTMVTSSVSRRSFMKQAAVVGSGVLLAGCATEPAVTQEAVSESAPMTAMTAEEILTPRG